MAVVCSYVVKELFAFVLVESFYDSGEQFGDSGFLSLLGPANGSVGKGLIATGKGKPKSVNRGRFNRVLRRKE